MRKFYILIFTILSYTYASSQTGINTKNPDASAALDIKSTDKGLLIPRLSTTEKLQITTPKEGLMVYDTNLDCVSLYTFLPWNSALGWTCLGNQTENFFYMPSMNIDTSVLGTNREINLYDYYKNQFTNPLRKSNSNATLNTYNSDQLYYYVTYYDKTKIKINSISSDGLMNYDVIGHANFDSYMNVIFVVK